MIDLPTLPTLVWSHSLSTLSSAEAFTIALLLVVVYAYFPQPAAVKVPLAGYRSWLEPTFLVRFRFLNGAQNILTAAYHKVKSTITVQFSCSHLH
jgi:hypothetical protein